LILPYLKYCLIWQTDCICQLQFLATNTAYLIRFWGHRKLIIACGQFPAVSHGIWQTGQACGFGKICHRKLIPSRYDFIRAAEIND